MAVDARTAVPTTVGLLAIVHLDYDLVSLFLILSKSCFCVCADTVSTAKTSINGAMTFFVIPLNIPYLLCLSCRGKCNHFLPGFLRLLFVYLGRDKAHVLNLPVVADVAELGCGSVIDTWRIG